MTYWVHINNREEFYLTQQLLFLKGYNWINGDNLTLPDPGAKYIIYSEKHKTIYWDDHWNRLFKKSPNFLTFNDFLDKIENEL